jgi:hypothetical protein
MRLILYYFEIEQRNLREAYIREKDNTKELAGSYRWRKQ